MDYNVIRSVLQTNVPVNVFPVIFSPSTLLSVHFVEEMYFKQQQTLRQPSSPQLQKQSIWLGKEVLCSKDTPNPFLKSQSSWLIRSEIAEVKHDFSAVMFPLLFELPAQSPNRQGFKHTLSITALHSLPSITNQLVAAATQISGGDGRIHG